MFSTLFKDLQNQLKNLTEQLQKAQNKTFTNKILNNKKRNRFLMNSSRKTSYYENTDTDIESGYEEDKYEQEQIEDNSSITHYDNAIQKNYPNTIKEMNSHQKKALRVRSLNRNIIHVYYILFIIIYLL